MLTLPISALSYAAASIGYFVLFILLVTSWRGKFYGILLAIACIASSLWAANISAQSYWDYPSIFSIEILEIIKNLSWSLFLIILLGPFQKKGSKSSTLKLKPSVIGVLLFYLVAIVVVIYAHDTRGVFSSNYQTDYLMSVIMPLIGMILIEQYYRNTPVEQRWGIKFFCLGIGGFFVYDFFLFSDALLLGKVNADIWDARGWVNLLTVPLVGLSAARNPKWSVGISLSRQILFYSSTLFGAAIYLLAMASVGYYIRLSGGTWGTVLQLTFLFGAIVLLLVILSSGTTRSWLKVFISKNFYSYNYDYREEWLRFTRTLSEESLDLRTRVIKSLAQLIESPAGILWYKSEQGEFKPAASWNFSLKTYDTADHSNDEFCQFLNKKRWVIDLDEYRLHPQKYSGLALPSWVAANEQLRLIIPLIFNNELVGFIALAEPRSIIKLNWEVRDLLWVASTQATSYLVQYEVTTALSLARQFESFNRMSTFVVHDIKNLIFQLSLLLTNAEKHKENPEFQKDMMETVNFSVNKMQRLLEKLNSDRKTLITECVLLDQLLKQIVQRKLICEPQPTLVISDENLMVKADLTRLERVIGHLIQNAIEATPKTGFVKVKLSKRNNNALIEIEDSGHGMSEAFIKNKLFRPFETTKTAGMGIGVFESKEYISELGGRLEVSSRELVGTKFLIILPLTDDSEGNK